MRRTVRAALAAVALLIVHAADARGEMTRTWFDKQPCSSLTIRQHRSLADHALVRVVAIADAAYLARLVAAIAALPAKGEEMIDFGGRAPHVELDFVCGGVVRSHQIISGKLQTPGTGFNSNPSAAEQAVLADIDALLVPAFDKPIPKVVGLELAFAPKGGVPFRLTYLGETRYDFAPATASGSTDFFVVTAGKTPVVVEIPSGQVPPQPVALRVGRTKPSLVTFESKAGLRLFPTHFQLTR